MKKVIPVNRLMLALMLLGSCVSGQVRNLPQGWKITPVGAQIRLPGDFPGKIVESEDGKQLFVVTSGFHHQGLTIIGTKSQKVLSALNLGKVYGDIAINRGSSEVFLPGGGAVDSRKLLTRLQSVHEQTLVRDFNAAVIRGLVRGDRTVLESPVTIPDLNARSQYVTGVALGGDGALFAININNDTVYRLSPPTFAVEAKARAGYGAYRVAVSPDDSLVAVSNWGDQSVTLFTTKTLHQVATVHVGIHPNDLMFGRDGRLFVANAGSNSVSIIFQNHVIETIKTSLQASDPVGSTPDAVAVDPEGKRLFVANADNNDVAVVDIANAGHSEVEGFIPTGWYPSALLVSGDGKALYIGVAKGLESRSNVPGISMAPKLDANSPKPYDFVGDTLSGYLSVVPIPDDKQLDRFTQMVRSNVPDPQPDRHGKAHASEVRLRVFPRIRHVLYIIRENRTYDQVLGDLGKGNGDPSLTMFGASVTPNAHRIAREWSLLDNLYVNGEVSENGHQWSDAAYSTQFTSQAWLQTYSGRSEPKVTESELGADERLRSSPAGYLWDNCARHGVTFRTYGEYAYFHSGPDEGPRFVAKGLEGHASIEWLKAAASGWHDITKGNDPDLARIFIRDLQKAELTGQWPRFTVMSLGEDHTHALRPGDYTPSAMVASNDQALGEIVEAVSHSRFWADTAIFVIEDDAQDGPDHVDCRRTEGFVISPYVKRHAVDSTAYTTASMIRTMEMILGLPPMTQFDRSATPMYKCFTVQPDFHAYTNMPPATDLFARNPSKGPGAEASAKLDLSQYDRADPASMNRILWEAWKPGTRMPPPVRSALLHSGE